MTTEVHKLDPDADCSDAVHRAAECLARGGLVAFPTETVYGLGVNAANPEAVARLREVKQRRPRQPFTVHIPARSAVESFVPGLPGLGRRLINKAWPGPLTLIFRVDDVASTPAIRETADLDAAAIYHEGTIGIRCPDDRTAAELLRSAGVPVVAASANRAGAPAPVEGHEVLEALDGEVDLLLDAGRTRYARASTIVRVDGNGYELLREGVIDERTLRRLANLNFLIVCTGNTCRSPMSVGLLRPILAEQLGCKENELSDRGIHVESAGTAAFGGASASPLAVEVLQARKIDITAHRSQPLTVELINRADYIFTMTDSHQKTVVAMTAGSSERSRLIDEDDIEDPIGGDQATYTRCADRIDRALRRRLEEIQF